MKTTTTLVLAAAALGASFTSAMADAYWKAGDLVPAEQAQVRTAPKIVEGRQATPVASETVYRPTAAEQFVIDQNRPHR